MPTQNHYQDDTLQGIDITLDDALWERLIQLTDGAAALCYQCGVCTAICPWGMVRQQHLSVRSMMRQAQLGLVNRGADLWLCTNCAQCQAYCPRGVDISNVFRGLRMLAWERNAVQNGLPTVLWSLYWNDNPWSQPPSQRAGWARDLRLPAFDPAVHEILLYVGCTSSYDRRAVELARALVRVLQAAGVSFGYLGEAEPCCGEAALSLGHKPYFQEIAAETTRVFQENGVRALVTISPHCYDVFKNHYPKNAGQADFTAWHYTQYLAQLVDQGRLKFQHNVNQQLTFQDPCYLGRHNDEYQAPRRLIEALPGVEFVEMADHAADGLCCGGGGGRMWLETAPGERFSDLRVRQALDTGMQTLVTACPFCLVCLEDSAKQVKGGPLHVMDLVEIIAQAL
jgi:Fe-S oxidoreductase